MRRFDLTPEEITSRPLYRVVPVLAAPLLLQNLVIVVQRLVDLFWVGRLSGDAVAAVGLSVPISALVNIAVVGIPYLGVQVLTSQRVGAEDERGARRVTFNGLLLGAGLGLVLGVGASLAAPALVDLVTVLQPTTEGSSVRSLAVAYVEVTVLGQFFAVLADTVEASLVARGDSRGALALTLVVVGANVVFDPLLAFGVGPLPALGIRGVALASVLSYVLAALTAAVFVLRRRRGGVLSRAAATVSRGDLREIVSVGWPPAAQRANQFVARLLVTIVVFGAGGAAGVAGYIVGSQFFSVALVPALGIQKATQSVVGQNLGADRPDRAARTGPVGGAFLVAVLVPVAAGQWLAAPTIAGLLAPDLAGVGFDNAVAFLRLLAWSYPAVGVVYALQGAFNGASRSRVSFYASVLQFWVVQLPLAAAVGLVFASDIRLVFLSVTVAKVATGLALALYHLRATRSGVFESAAGEVDGASGD